MPDVLVRDVPEETHRALLRRAQARGLSLQQYLAGELVLLAATPSLDEVWRRVASRNGGRVGLAQAAADLSDENARE